MASKKEELEFLKQQKELDDKISKAYKYAEELQKEYDKKYNSDGNCQVCKQYDIKLRIVPYFRDNYRWECIGKRVCEKCYKEFEETYNENEKEKEDYIKQIQELENKLQKEIEEIDKKYLNKLKKFIYYDKNCQDILKEIHRRNIFN